MPPFLTCELALVEPFFFGSIVSTQSLPPGDTDPMGPALSDPEKRNVKIK
jgi:hypothetical protein